MGDEQIEARCEAIADDLPAEPVSVRVSHTVRLTGLLRSTLFEGMVADQIETMKVGRSNIHFLSMPEEIELGVIKQTAIKWSVYRLVGSMTHINLRPKGVQKSIILPQACPHLPIADASRDLRHGTIRAI